MLESRGIVEELPPRGACELEPIAQTPLGFLRPGRGDRSAPWAVRPRARSAWFVTAVALLVLGSLVVSSSPLQTTADAHPSDVSAVFTPSVARALNASPAQGNGSGPNQTQATETWQDLTASAGEPPSARAASQAAYDPALGEVILFGGFQLPFTADGDTWAFSAGVWSPVITGASTPPARWGGAMVYDAADGYLVLFGGRNTTEFLNDTWIYNATGWHALATPVAPSPRGYFGLTYDAADGYVLLFGGGVGNIPNPAGSPWAIYGDTWTFHAGVWTNITASAGAGPAPRLVGAMAYDATDGYVLLVAGSNSRDFTDDSCPYIFPDEWTFSGGRWSPLVLTSSVEPPGGFGTLWYDASSHALMYYDGIENLSASDCDALVGNVWTYASGVWQLAWSSGESASPPPRYLEVTLYDAANSTSLLFAGYQSFSGPAFSDTWSLSVLRQTFGLEVRESGLEPGTTWQVALTNDANALDPVLTTAAPQTIEISVLNGTYDLEVGSPTGYRLESGSASQAVRVDGEPVVIALAFAGAPPASAPPNAPALGLAPILGGGVAGVVAAGIAAFLLVARRRSRLRTEGEEVIRRMLAEQPRPGPRRR
jgi:hypothetical protein